MSKRHRSGDVETARHAITLICQRPAKSTELEAVTLTPLEKQVVSLKESIPADVLLMVACGYRVKYYGRDSRVASRRLGIMCIPTTPFESSSIPYVRVNLYIHRLVAMGYRVAFADQENAAIRATSGSAKGIFTREITRVYSRGTLLPSEVIGGTSPADAVTGAGNAASADQGDGTEGASEDDGPVADGLWGPLKEESSELFMCFVYSPSLGSAVMEMTLVSFVRYCVTRHRITSEAELMDVLHRHDIVEVIIFHELPQDVMRSGENSFCTSSSSSLSALRRLPEAYASALSVVLPLHFGPTCNGEEDDRSVSVSVAAWTGSMDESIISSLVPYRLDKVYAKMCATGERIPFLESVTDAKINQTMDLPGSTLSALDIFTSSIGIRGSLLALLDHSLTVAGARRLRTWLAAPPCDVDTIMSRRDAVTLLVRGEEGDAVLKFLRECAKFGDIEATLGKLHAQRCTVAEYLHLLRAVKTAHSLATGLLSRSDGSLKGLIQDILLSITSTHVSGTLESCRYEVDSLAASPLEYFVALGEPLPPAMQTHVETRDEALRALDKELECIRQMLRMPALEYRTIAGTAFIVDVPQAMSSRAPKDWLVLTRTKSHVRFHTPKIIDLNVQLCSARERLIVAANAAWQTRQQHVAECAPTMRVFRDVIDAIAVLDALYCLAVTSSAPGYVAPELSGHAKCVTITGGRHPVLDSVMRGRYVGCDVELIKGGAWILTGPNMGGKSALMRMVGTFVVMAQLGCYVPATAAQLPVFTAVYCRMGASDSMLEGASTFLKEMEETSRILHSSCLSSSLVLLDELGRGTSSFDGIAVAAATLEYLLKHGSTTLFVTHYSQLCEPYANADPGGRVACYYMGFREEKQDDADGGEINLVFTYKPTPGVTPSSFGVRVAKMAGLPSEVVAEAQRRSESEEKVHLGRVALMQVRHFLGASTC
ncbi:mismatch repair protein MSH3 [Trypanosoma grayi]|uniref:mismatch repair protein MSH3 n=1 Tax=Trypanosoma grayi TaxID=71804 RepID=UPI0004F48EA3|nr:mismatch repair protein MSH3 [Trypanosoma grayi]KEG13915.1 mismatch repair protein MSH3 [Trypanosoma grayi]